MRTLLVAVVVSVGAGCASAPSAGNEFTASGTTPLAQAFDCIADRADDLGFAVSTRGASELRLERVNDDPWWLNIIGLNDSVDVLVANQAANGRVRLAAYSLVLRGQERDAAAPSEEARTQAQTIVAACGG